MAIGKHNNPMLRNGFMALAVKLQEAAGDLSSNDVARRLGDAVAAAHKGSGTWAYYIDHFGDPDGGDVVYSCNGTVRRAPYSVAGGDADGEAQKYAIDTDEAQDVYPRTIYEVQPDEDDHYSRMEEAFRSKQFYTGLPLYERFISQKERDAADASDFAGKGKSYPILSPADVSAAAHALGRAGSSNLSVETIKKNIIAIAKRKGWTKYLPKAWQDGGSDSGAGGADTKAKEGADKISQSKLILVESAGPAVLEDIFVSESARTNYPVKLISPGTGTMAHYPADVLERDGPKVFKAGTLMFWNHPTRAEEAARPEGDLDNLAAILTKDAWYDANGKKGPGLYSEAKVMADYAQKVEDRAPFIGLSIRAGGKGSGRVVNGKPELASIDHAESVDYVTKAGRGGMALVEAARGAGLLPMETKEAKKKPMKDCPDCKGTGQCAKCEGVGKVSEAAKAMTECTDCQGSGDCAGCDGNGKIMESARGAQKTNQEKEMDENTVKQLIEAAVTAAVTPLSAKLTLTEAANQTLLDRALRGDAREAAAEVFQGMSLRESAKKYVLTESLVNLPVKDGQLDVEKFKESVTKRAKDIAALVGEGGGSVRGMGAAPVIDTKEAERQEAELKQIREAGENVFLELFEGNKEAAKAAVNYKGVAA